MRRGFIIVCVLSIVAATFFVLVARQADDPSPFYVALSRAREKESRATYSIVYAIEDSFGSTQKSARETAVRLGPDRYRSDATDDSGYTIIVIEQPEARFQCEASETIQPQCYRTDLRGPLTLHDSFFDGDRLLPVVPSSTEFPSTNDTPWESPTNKIGEREVLGEATTCFIEESAELQSETCFSDDGLLLYARSEFELAGQTFVMISEAVSIDRQPLAVNLEPPYPLVEPPTAGLGDLTPVIESR